MHARKQTREFLKAAFSVIKLLSITAFTFYRQRHCSRRRGANRSRPRATFPHP